MNNDHQTRIGKLQQLLKKNNIEALFITDPFNIRYLANFTGTNGQIFVTPEKCLFFTDFRYRAVAKKVLPINIRFIEVKNGLKPFLTLNSFLKKKGIKTVNFEEKHLTVLRYRKLKKMFASGGIRIKFKPAQNIVESLREIKSKEELRYIIKAQRIAEKVFLEVKNSLQPGKTEMDIAMEIEQLGQKFGADGISFPAIVGFSKNSASPHHQNTNRRLKKGDIVLIDMGMKYKGYCSDMTRMIFTKKPTPIEQKIYSIVLEAQEKAIKRLMAGVKASAADKLARAVIQKEGYGKYFGHSLGHGIGLEVHEGPTLSANYHQSLPENTIVTVEPGIYLENFFGVRIEDMVLIQSNGVKNLTKIPKEIGSCVVKLIS